jgi:hypothetical protein
MTIAAGTLRVQESTDLQAASFTMPGDGAYPTGGTLLFSTYVSTLLGKSVTLVAAWGTAIGAPGYSAVYYPATDALKLSLDTTGAEAAASDLSAISLEMVVLYK